MAQSYSVGIMENSWNSYWQLLKKALRHLYWSNHLVAMVSSLSLLPAFFYLKEDVHWQSVIFVYVSSYLVYCLDRSFNLSPEDKQNNPERKLWLQRYQLRSRFSFVIYAFLSFYLYFKLSFSSRVLLIVLTIPTLAYVLPIIPYKGWRRSKEFILGKSFNISFVWAALAVFLPVSELGGFHWGMLLLFLFSFALTLTSCQFFDLRDFQGDKEAGVRSLPVLYGEGFCRLLIQYICIGSIVLSISLSYLSHHFFLCFVPIAIFYLWMLRCKKLEPFDYILVDLALLLPALMSLIFSTL